MLFYFFCHCFKLGDIMSMSYPSDFMLRKLANRKEEMDGVGSMAFAELVRGVKFMHNLS